MGCESKDIKVRPNLRTSHITLGHQMVPECHIYNLKMTVRGSEDE